MGRSGACAIGEHADANTAILQIGALTFLNLTECALSLLDNAPNRFSLYGRSLLFNYECAIWFAHCNISVSQNHIKVNAPIDKVQVWFRPSRTLVQSEVPVQPAYAGVVCPYVATPAAIPSVRH